MFLYRNKSIINGGIYALYGDEGGGSLLVIRRLWIALNCLCGTPALSVDSSGC